MRNIPRIYLNAKLASGAVIELPVDTAHYLTRVMRIPIGAEFLVFNNGAEFMAELTEKKDSKKSAFYARISKSSGRADPSNNLTLAFAPIKQARLEEMMNMAAQMGVARLQPVITERTVANRINWERIGKIITEAAEQSGRNSIPEILPAQKFDEFLGMFKVQSSKFDLFFADERFTNMRKAQDSHKDNCTLNFEFCTLLIGPEGGFSDKEFTALDKIGAVGMNLGKTILRAETAAVAAIAQLHAKFM